ncbi:ATP-binding protein [Pseudomonas oryzihabitans]|uniref:ATP-binding protein n=1 Tax=Pseudomonas oryzihabitans TaxID=47885 RepID=UPI0011A9BEE5|nr:ATP-binding protein [Pseudomonas psychrotolerans]
MVSHAPIFTRAPAIIQVDHNSRHCPDHGSYAHQQVEQFDGAPRTKGCSRCQWQALNLADVPSGQRANAQAEAARTLVNERLIRSGVTERFKACTFDSFMARSKEQAHALSVCQAYAAEFPARYQAGQCLLMLGNVGTGKTHLASAVVQQVIRRHRAQAVIVSASSIFRAAKAAMSRTATFTEENVLAELAGFDLLVVDEVGASKGSDWEVALLHEVIDRRYQGVRPTIVISNLDRQGMQDYIGARAMDRLRQGGGELIGFTWNSERRTAP